MPFFSTKENPRPDNSFYEHKGLVAAITILEAALLFVAVPGCGSGNQGLAVVKGKVTYKGKPVPNGTVNFNPVDGNKPSASGKIQPDGSYTLETFLGSRPRPGAVIGSHKVVIVAMQDQEGILPEQRAALPPPIVPSKYTHPNTTDLKAEVENKENTIDFDLKD
jgi:hypothetical protein